MKYEIVFKGNNNDYISYGPFDNKDSAKKFMNKDVNEFLTNNPFMITESSESNVILDNDFEWKIININN